MDCEEVHVQVVLTDKNFHVIVFFVIIFKVQP